MSFSLGNVVASLELALAAAGLVLWRRLIFSPAARAARRQPRLPRWDASIADFVIFLVCVVCGSLIAASVAGLAAKALPLRGDPLTVFLSAFTQLGMLGGVWFFWSNPDRGPPIAPAGNAGILKSGAATFLVSLPLLLLTAKLWELLLDVLHLPTERQSLIDMFANADSPWLLIVMITLAVVIAPLTEELVFRAGLFRFLRSRTPRWFALFLSALLFASLHVNWPNLEGLSSLLPLMVLAVMFSLAYEHTGNIGTPIVAHGLFNLNTIVLIFAGVGT
jgi:membrane protease YdiL (CAAX protease family)